MIFRLDYGSDISESIASFCSSKKIGSAAVFFIGAVKKATVGFYDQKTKKYKKETINKPMEIVSGIGNISLKDGRHFLHAHVTLSDKKGVVTGGHLFSPTVVFACEAVVIKNGKKLVRTYDEKTGLYLWRK